MLHSFRENSRHSAILILQGMERKHNWGGFRAAQGSSPGRGMLCMFPLPLLESTALGRGGRGEVGGWIVHVLHRRYPIPVVPGRKLVRVVVLDLGPCFATQLCFLPAGVRKGERSHDFQRKREVLRQGGIQSLGSCVTLRKLSCLDLHF